MQYRFFYHPHQEADPELLQIDPTCSFDVEEFKFSNNRVMVLDGCEVIYNGKSVGNKVNNYLVISKAISKDMVRHIPELDLYYIPEPEN